MIIVPRQVRGIFVGYQDQQSVGWRIYTPENNEFLITSHAQFDNDKYNKYLPVGYEHTTNNSNSETTTLRSVNETPTLETVLTKLNNLPTTDTALSSSSSSRTADTLKRRQPNQEDYESRNRFYIH